jgi:tetratricopeptide (TPR) repeat protein
MLMAESNPGAPEPWKNRGELLLDLKRYDEALECYEIVIDMKKGKEKDRDAREAWLRKLEILNHIGDYRQLMKTCKDARSFGIEDFEVWYYMGLAMMADGGKEEALVAFDRALEIKESPEVLCEKAKILLQMGQYIKALNAVKRAAKNGMACWITKAAVLRAAGKPRDALKALEKEIKENPQNDFAWFEKALTLQGMKQHRKASRAMDVVLAIEPDNELYWLEKGRILMESGAHGKALKYFDEAIRLNKEFGKAWLYKAKALEHTNMRAESKECLRVARRLMKGLPESDT